MTAPGTAHVYRPDVDGLRAVAVLAVLAFHAFPRAAPGGFAGVDVFFVISGFLITGILLEGLRDGSFSFAGFYWRRIRRIFPALILVLAACLALGWLLLLPDEFSRLGRHVAAGAGFVANLALWLDVGYFDIDAEHKPLLHLWSLGVEEQYYLVWPLLLFLLRARPRRLPAMILALGALSLAACFWLTAQAPAAAFYLPVTRFWELMAGSLLACVAPCPQRYAHAAAAAGLALLAAALALLHPGRAFPGGWALLPVLGTALLVWAGPSAWINRRILAHPLAVFVGLISYPLYLWHWPLLSYARIVEGAEPSAATRSGLLALSVVLAWLTYALVERKIRFPRRAQVKRIAVPALAASMAAVGVAGVLALDSRLLPQSASVPLIREISAASSDWTYSGDGLMAGDTPSTVLFFGDSHMQQYWPRIHKVVSERIAPVRSALFKTAGGCAPVPGIERRSVKCAEFVEEGLRLALEPQVDTVVIAASWVGFVSRRDYYRVGDPRAAPLDLLAADSAWVLQGFEAALRKLVRAGKRVVIVLSSPRGEAFDPKSAIQRDGFTIGVRAAFEPVPRSKLVEASSPIDSRLIAIAAAAGAAVIDPTQSLCGASHCPSADEHGRPLYKDASHLRSSVVRERFLAVDKYLYLGKAPAP